MKTLRHLFIAFLTYGSSFAQFISDMNFTDIYGISPIENCDLVDLLSIEVNSQNGAPVLNVLTDSPYLIYATHKF